MPASQKIYKCQRCTFTTGKGAGALSRHYSQSLPCHRTLGTETTRIVDILNERGRRRPDAEERSVLREDRAQNPGSPAASEQESMDDLPINQRMGDPPTTHQDRNPSHRTTVEEVPDEGDPYVVQDQTAGKIYEKDCETRWEERLREDQKEGLPPWAPFADEEEMELGHFLWQSGMSQQSMDKFFKMRIVSRVSCLHMPHSLITHLICHRLETGPSLPL